MAEAGAVVRTLPAARALFVDDRGVGLRATWHHDLGVVNLSVWRGDRCTETFRLTVADSADLIAFLAGGLAEAAGGPATGAGPGTAEG